MAAFVKTPRKQRNRDARLICTGKQLHIEKAPKGFQLTYAHIPETGILDTVVLMVALESPVNIATKLLCLKHGRKWVILGLTDQDLQVFSVVGNRAESPLVPVTEASHAEGVFLLNIECGCSFLFYRFLGTPNCRRVFIQSCSAHNKWICAASAAVRKGVFCCARPGGYQTQRKLEGGC